MGNAASAASVATADQSALLRIETAGPVLSVGLNRPAKRNALNDGIVLAIQDCFQNIPEGIGAVVIHGIGDHFSSGLDLSELTEHDATDGLRHSQMWHRVRRISASPNPQPILHCPKDNAASSSAVVDRSGCRD
jgi:enoyl-CoA hydratase/carnithine racemase